MNSQVLEVASVDLSGCRTVGEMAQREGIGLLEYSSALAESIRSTGVPLDRNRERFAALVGVGSNADRASAEELGNQFHILEALYHRFSIEAVETLERGGHGAVERSEKLLNAALKAQRAGMAVLSALKVLRDGASAAGLVESRETK